MRINSKSNQILFYAIVFGIILLCVQIAVIVFSKSFEFNYGYEYGKIAISIFKGTGYGNPWGGNTGPTATMPPILVYIHLIGLYLFGSLNIGAFLFVSFIKIIAYAFSYYYIAKVIETSRLKIVHPVLLSLFVLFILLSSTLNFWHTGDLWLSVFIISWFLYAGTSYFILTGRKYLIQLAVVCFLTPMINPAFALGMSGALGILTLLRLSGNYKKLNVVPAISRIRSVIIDKNIVPFYRMLIICILSFALSVGIWTTRNYLVFHTFIPTKSNLWLEVYLANIVDKDGVLSYSTVIKSHPTADENIKAEILKIGEINWFKQFEVKGKIYMKEHKSEYYRKVRNRLFNAFIMSQWDMDVYDSPFLGKLDSTKRELLIKNKLIVNNIWSCLDLSETDFLTKIDSLKLTERNAYLNDWENSKKNILLIQQSLKYKLRGLLFALVPSLIFICLLFFPFYRKSELFIAILVTYILYLIPYILVSHQLRYQRPLMTLQIVLLYFIFYELYKLVSKKKISA